MPKPNGYYFYMKWRKENDPKCRNKSFAELSSICSEGWNNLPSERRQVFHDMKNNTDIRLPKPGKKNKNTPTPVMKGETDIYNGQDSMGRSLIDIKNKMEEQKDRESEEYKYLYAAINNMLLDDIPVLEEQFYVIHCTNYCITDVEPKTYCPAEITIGRFSIEEGYIESDLHVFCQKGKPPTGFALQIKENCENILKLQDFDFSEALSLEEVAEKIHEFSTKIKSVQKLTKRMVFTHPAHRETCWKNLVAIFGSEDDIPFEVQSLGHLTAAIHNVKEQDDRFTLRVIGELIHEGRRPVGDYYKLCDYHLETDGALCSTEILSKWSTAVCEVLTPVCPKPVEDEFFDCYQ